MNKYKGAHYTLEASFMLISRQGNMTLVID